MNDQSENNKDTPPPEVPQDLPSSEPTQPAVTDEVEMTPDADIIEPPTGEPLPSEVSAFEVEKPLSQLDDEPTPPVIVAPVTQAIATPHAARRKWLVWGIAAAIVVGLVASVLVYLNLTSKTPMSSDDAKSSAKQVAKLGAAITYVQGTVEYARADGWKAVDGELSLSEGDRIRTGNESRAIVAFDDGSAIRLDAQSEVTLKSLTVTSVVVENQDGNVYSRVTASDSRTFDVVVSDITYRAMGTAYMTTNSDTTEGVEVYQSKVSVDEKTTVSEGEGYYAKTTDETKRAKVTKLDVAGLKASAFLKWNKSEDAKEAEFADKLGVLKDIDVETPEQKQTQTQTQSTTTTQSNAAIALRGEKTDEGILVSWTTSGIDTTKGFKVAYSKSNASPAYGSDSAKFVDGSARSVKLEIQDGKTWHIRVCRYDGDGKCSYYSNAVSVAAPYEEAEEITTGTTSAVLAGSTISWTFTGTAPNGFKVAWNTSGSPTYPPSGSNASAKYMPSGNSLNLSEAISAPGTYKVRVCKYTNTGTCVDYSSEVTYVKS